MSPYLEVIAREWGARADELARWAYTHMVNRTDVWGSYLPLRKRREGFFFFTAPFAAARGKEFLTPALLARHFCGLDGHLLSLHSSSADKTSRWLAIDIDRHDKDEASTPEANFAAALAWHDKLAAMGFDPLLFDSNGNGGYHVLIIFAEPVPTADAYDLGQRMTDDWEKRALPRRPETYPRHVNMDEDSKGNCLRLFGRHHTREHFTKVWSGEPDVQEWLEGAGAIDRILAVRPALPSLLPKTSPQTEHKTIEKKEERERLSVSRKQRPRVCVDLDGVLATYDGWKGLDFTGLPLPGAAEFTRKLSEFAEIVIFTTRCSVEPHRDELGEPTRPASDLAPRLLHNVRYWLEKYKFTFDEIYVGQGKPIASAYVDDRAVFCGPQYDPHAYLQALSRVRELCNRGRHQQPPPPSSDPRLQRLIENWEKLPEAARAKVEQAAGLAAEPEPAESKPAKKSRARRS
ncbi:MAG TPA: hypothetical protein VEJ63_22520 [Planctomycetota bacterium]|nr:hypothetical protein [Planctomycetota bacterium]